MANNITEVRLLNVPLENDYLHSIQFSSKTEQTNYFIGRTVYSESDFSYQRKDNIIRYPKQYDELSGCNYVMYKNAAYGSKWFYAFITDMDYISDGRTDIHIKTDVIQTWLFDYTIKSSFVEREHVNDDTVGKHTVPEGLETGEYICDNVITNSDLQKTSIVIGCTLDINNYTNQSGDWNLSKEFKPLYGGYYDGLYSGLSYFKITPSQLKTILKHIAYEGQEDAVHCLFMAPSEFLPDDTEGTYANSLHNTITPKQKSWDCGSVATSLDGYTPKNKKLLTSPFCYMFVDNGGGGSVEYQYEKFIGDNITFDIYSVLTPGMSIRAIPIGYNGISGNNCAEGINLSKYATCSWVSDAYTSWLTQSAVNVGLSTVGAIAAGVGSVALAPATGGGSLAIGASIVGGVAGVGSSVAAANERLSTPPQIHGNTNSGDVSTARGDVTFRCYKMSIKKEYAKIIDGYFSMYGYKVNSLKVPNKNHRENYWYTKLIDPNIVGPIPMNDLIEIKNCYSRGITFWKNPTNIRDYSVSNGIV